MDERIKPFSNEELVEINENNKDFLVDFIANSISFETLPISKETVEKIFDNDFDNIDDKTILVVKNYLNGILYCKSLLKNNKELTENDLKDIHDKVVNGFSLGGLYRNVDISIKGSNHTPPSYLKVYDRMKKYFDMINDANNDMYYNIAFAHLQLMKIHPFLDGNGRVARIVLNYELEKNGLKPIIISYAEKDHYFDLLEQFKVNKDINPFIGYIKEKQQRL